jgi:hypothetical protein
MKHRNALCVVLCCLTACEFSGGEQHGNFIVVEAYGETVGDSIQRVVIAKSWDEQSGSYTPPAEVMRYEVKVDNLRKPKYEVLGHGSQELHEEDTSRFIETWRGTDFSKNQPFEKRVEIRWDRHSDQIAIGEEIFLRAESPRFIVDLESGKIHPM